MANTTHCFKKIFSFNTRRTPTALAVAGLIWNLHSTSALAQDAATLPTVKISTQTAAPTSTVSGFGDEDLARTPINVQVIDQDSLKTHGIRRVSDVLQRDASASDAYNAIGYWDYVTLRGFVLDNTYNHRRDGLPISAETSLGLENRESIELLKGTSGIQAGTSAPGGLVNHTLKRPPAGETPIRSVRLEANQYGNLLGHVDLGGRFGVDQALGYRLNVAGERLRNQVSTADGNRQLVALALDWRLRPGSVLEVELEHSRRSQPSVPGLSLLGDRFPPADPRLNLNQQPWSQPGLMQGLTGSVRYEHSINTDWRWSIHAARQALKADDYLAYPYGCYAANTDTYYADRYCPNGDVDVYDFRSLNERRTLSSVQLKTEGKVQTGQVQHHLSMGLLQTRYTERGEPQADNNDAVGSGNIYTLPALPANATFSDPYTQRTERSTEVFAYDRIVLNPQWSTWLGLRHSHIERDSIRTDGSRATAYSQRFTTPWLALAWQWQPSTLLYASTGQGAESQVAPGRSRYTNAGQALPALKSRQWELGLKHRWATGQAQATLFSITRPRAGDAGACDIANSCTLQMDGDDLHRGLELNARETWGPLTLDTSVMWLSAERRNGTINPSLNGKRPTNVPDWVLRATASYALPQVPGLTAHLGVSHEGRRTVLPDESLELPSWTRVDAGLSYKTRIAGHSATWRLNVKNLFNRRYFQESPYQYSHIYLFPAAPRTVQFGLETAF